jgi:hypothetical protein
LGEESPAPVTGEAADAVDEATIVRPRPAALSKSDTPVDGRINTPQPSDAQAGMAARQEPYGLPGSPYVVASENRRNSTLIWVAVIVALIAAGVAAYLILGGRAFGPATTREAITDAQQSVTTAIALVDSLPKDHPLRTYLTNLRTWQGELKAYQEVNGDNTQVTQRAERYRQQADDIAGQARVALAALGREAPANVNAPVPSNENRPVVGLSPANENRQAASANDNINATDEEGGEATQEKNHNANANRRRRIEPPAVEPVQSPEAAPQNANRRKDRTPPKTNPVNDNESSPDSQR